MRKCCGNHLDIREKKSEKDGENYVTIKTILKWSNQGGCDELNMQHAWGDEKFVHFGWRSLMGRDYFGGKKPRRKDNIKMGHTELGNEGRYFIKLL